MKISKELLSEVSISNELRKLVDPNNECCCDHCLGHKCKEWAYEKGFILLSCNETCQIIPNDCQAHSDLIEHSIGCDDELNGVFKACQWILKNLKD